MYRLVPALVREMGDAYPRAACAAQPLITETLQLEETRFRKTLEQGPRPARRGDRHAQARATCSPATTAFKLYDTYGFPLDLTQDALRAARHHRRHRRLRRRDGAAEGRGAQGLEGLGRGRDRDRSGSRSRRRPAPPSSSATTPRPPRARSSRSSRTARRSRALKAGDEAALVLNQTPFYGESGGQVGDQGVITGAKGALFRVTDTQKKLGDLFVHLGTVEKGSFKAGDAVELDVDHARRTAIRANHSATHLLHEALRQVLGDARRAEGLARRARPAALRLLAHQADDAPRRSPRSRSIANAIVAAERAGRDAADGASRTPCSRAPWRCSARSTATRCASSRWATAGRQRGNKAWSVELCGGTHVARTGDIGLVKVVARERDRGRRAPHRGADRRAARAPTSPSRTRACARSPRLLHGAPRTWSSASRRWSTSASSSSGSSPTPRSRSRSAAAASRTPAPAIIEVGGRKLLALLGLGRQAEGSARPGRRRQEARSAPASSPSPATRRTASSASSSASPTTSPAR